VTATRPTETATPQVVVSAPRRGVLGTLLQVVGLLVLLGLLAGVVLVLFALFSAINMPAQAAGGLQARLSALGQSLQAAADPTHPPAGLSYDAEYAALTVLGVGEALPGGTAYQLTVLDVKKRSDGAPSPDTAQYAVIRAVLRQPRETRLFGQVVRSDNDQHDVAVYKGETFRVGRALYRVNWISDAERRMAIATYRHPDDISAPLKFDYP
jgi:hypothetical protein